MKIYPLDIRRQTFKSRLRGADPEEVRTFLELVANDFEAVLQENAMQAERVKNLEERLDEFRALEQSMRNSLVTAERIVNEARDSSERDAQRMLQDAQARAERILTDARERLALLQQEIEMLRGKRDVLVRRFATMLESQLAVLQEHAPGGSDPAFGAGLAPAPAPRPYAGQVPSGQGLSSHVPSSHFADSFDDAPDFSGGEHSAGREPFDRASEDRASADRVAVDRAAADRAAFERDEMSDRPSARPRVPVRRAEPVVDRAIPSDPPPRSSMGDSPEAGSARGFGRIFRRNDGVLPVPGEPASQTVLPLKERREGVLEFSALEGRNRDPETPAGS